MSHTLNATPNPKDTHHHSRPDQALLGGRAPTPGQVLVLSSGGYPDVSHGGGTKLSRGDGHGLAGVLADGRLRDFDQLRGYSFATWSRGEAVPRGGDTVMPHDFGITVEISGVCVNSGDYVYMDNAGGCPYLFRQPRCGRLVGVDPGFRERPAKRDVPGGSGG
ncbi:hypothetical protein OG762_51280 (plasmid) [Streptomyces sp. NBC_01136]|uniref:RraA family protein n=1 Tax=unclassified Streptomyces TaxID=2593676 RepID=UPI002F9121AD|nr:hypothetical protein OG762_51280 [Streptomyces sp. NBC_01136]